jgi:hypothetical protein
MAHNQKPNLVIGAVRGYNFKQLRPFVVSLKRTAFHGDVVLLWNHLDDGTLNVLTQHGVKLVHFNYRGSGALNSWSRFWPVVSKIVRPFKGSFGARTILKAILPLQTARFLHYRDFLVNHVNEYQNVLITDVRDVIFQTDPFLSFDHELLVFEEPIKMLMTGEREFNAIWVERLFGTEALAQIGQFPILCSGTIMGTISAMIRYLTEFEKLLYRARDVGIGGSDQGVHNYLCRGTAKLTVQVSKNGTGPILTMTPAAKRGIDFEVSNSGEILGINGLPMPVLHQYDRHPELLALLTKQLFVST